MTPVRVTVWGENRHEKIEEHVRAIYPDGMHETIAEGIRENVGDGAVVTTATLDDPEHGLTEEALRGTDVLVWWGHDAHDDVVRARDVFRGQHSGQRREVLGDDLGAAHLGLNQHERLDHSR